MGRHNREHQITVKDMVHSRPELCIQLPVDVINSKANVWVDMNFDPDSKENGEWTNVYCMDQNLKFITKL